MIAINDTSQGNFVRLHWRRSVRHRFFNVAPRLRS